MTQRGIEPGAVNEPIQLLAAWWAGLILIDGAFLTAASQISAPEWAAGALVIAAIANVLIVVLLLFHMQTRFRSELLPAREYLQHLQIKASRETGELKVTIDTADVVSAIEQPAHPAQRVSIVLNDLAPAYSAIAADLSLIGMPPERTFGSTSSEPEVPFPFIITVGRSVDVGDLQMVLRLLANYRLSGICLTLREENENSIFIGAYNYKTTPDRVIRLDDATLDALLDPDLTRKRLFQLLTPREISFEQTLGQAIDPPA